MPNHTISHVVYWLNLLSVISSEPTGVRDLVVYPLSPTAVILSWQRPYHVAFRKYVLQTFFFNPATLVSEWTTYYEIAATASVIASVVSTGQTVNTHILTIISKSTVVCLSVLKLFLSKSFKKATFFCNF